jgi:hypothetical protein
LPTTPCECKYVGMIRSYIIQWKSKVNGRAGRGTKQFNQEDAERLVEELNHEYPQIHHEAFEVDTAATHEIEMSPEAVAA